MSKHCCCCRCCDVKSNSSISNTRIHSSVTVKRKIFPILEDLNSWRIHNNRFSASSLSSLFLHPSPSLTSRAFEYLASSCSLHPNFPSRKKLLQPTKSHQSLCRLLETRPSCWPPVVCARCSIMSLTRSQSMLQRWPSESSFLALQSLQLSENSSQVCSPLPDSQAQQYFSA